MTRFILFNIFVFGIPFFIGVIATHYFGDIRAGAGAMFVAGLLGMAIFSMTDT